MSSIAVSGGTGGVVAGSLYAGMQSVAMATPLLGPVVVVPAAAAITLYGGVKGVPLAKKLYVKTLSKL
ncbi:hypothetical protein WJX72_007475 [[Myrmecia] bisecta]|uniref:Uncharacterized protein n=1 Tax=[Myrmecia] bisecta TaxID=41462 RepID=A0AAW1Q7S0_9CHLO